MQNVKQTPKEINIQTYEINTHGIIKYYLIVILKIIVIVIIWKGLKFKITNREFLELNHTTLPVTPKSCRRGIR